MTWDEAVGDNVGVELHDSDMVAVDEQDGALVIRLSPAWLHRSEGVPGVDSGTLWNQDAVLRIGDSQISGDVPALPGDLVDGSLETVDRFFANVIPTHVDLEGKVRLSFGFRTGETMRVSGTGLRLDLEGEPEFIDVWPPA